MCKGKVSNFIFTFFIYKFFLLLFIFIDNHGKQRKMMKKLTIHCYAYQVKQNFNHMNGVRVLTVIDSEKRCEWRPSSTIISW